MRFKSVCGFVAPLLLGAFAGCSGGSSPTQEPSGSTEEADTQLPSSFNETPNPKPADWTFSGVDLLVADALAQCAYKPDGSAMASPSEADLTDKYVSSVLAEMSQTCTTSTKASGVASPFAAWVAKRGDAGCYKVDAGQVVKVVGLDTSATISTYGLTGDGAVALRAASVNHCVAQRLRSASPGASAQQALSMSLADQQQLLQVVHERAQIAMLQYGLLGLAFTSPSRPTGLVKSLGLSTDAGRLRQWAEGVVAAATQDGTLGKDPVTRLGRDLAGVIELDLAATEELAELFSHQAAADEAAAGPNLTVADAVWGKGSWRQRLMGLLYGGDALQGKAAGVVGEDRFPGIDNTAVFKNAGGVMGNLDNPNELDWPTKAELPYAQVSATDPRAVVLLGLAQQYDVLNLKPTASGACKGTDVAASAKQLYRAVEAVIRFKDCERAAGATACPAAPDPSSLPDEATGYSSFALFAKHKITPAHAQQLVAYLDDLLGDDCGATWVDGARVGALDVGGAVTPITIGGATWRHIGGAAGGALKSAQFAPRVLEEMAPLFARLGRFRMPKVIEYAVPLDQQGLVSGVYFNHAERKRALGTIEAFAATRDALKSAAMQNTPVGAAFLKLHEEISGAIAAAIGDRGVGISAHGEALSLGKPKNTFGPNVSPRQPAILAHTAGGRTVPRVGDADALDWDVDVTFPPSDTFWSTASPPSYTLIAIPDDPHAATFARFTGSARDGKSLESLVKNGYVSVKAPTPDPATSDGLLRWRFQIALPRKARWTLLAKRTDSGATKLLAANVTLASFTEACDGEDATDASRHSYYTATPLSPARPLEGQYLAFGGHFGMMAQRTLAPDTVDPTLPGFDGFGLSRRYVPPPDPRVLEGGASGSGAQPLADYHLGLAKTMSDDAQRAVQRVMDNLLKIATDKAAGQAAVERSKGTIEAEWGSLCGSPPAGTTPQKDPNDPSAVIPMCDKEMEAYHVDYASELLAQVRQSDPSFDPVNGKSEDGSPLCKEQIDLSIPKDPNQPPDWWKEFVPTLVDAALNKVPNPPIAAKQKELSTWLDCSTYKLLGALSMDTKIARAVRISSQTSNGSTSAPKFDQVWGGKLERAFRAQWSAFDQAKNVVKQVQMASSASKQHLTSFVAAYQAVQGKAAKNCSPAAMGEATLAGLSVGASAGFATASVSVNMSMGPLVAQGQKCNDMKADIDSSAQQALSNMWDLMTATITQASKLSDASRAIQDSASDIAQLVQQASLAEGQAKLEAKLTQDTLQTSFGLWRSIHNQDVYQAQTLLMAARKQALVARKAIETMYVVDLSKLYATEHFVLSPKTWANDVYTMDLDMAAAAGLTVGSTSPSSIYIYALSDYVTNLKQFRDGFFYTRPILHPDAKPYVIELPPPYADDPTDAVSWSFFCPNAAGTDGTWMDVPPALDQATWTERLEKACDRRIVKAKVRFSLDPWGGLGMLSPNAAPSTQFNTRWDKLFVNLKGTSVCDPSRIGSVPGRSCVTTQYVHASLTQIAPVWTTSYDGTWTPLGFGNATLQDVYALQLGYTFGINAFDDPNQGSFVKAATRRGFAERAMGGFYEIELNAVRPDGTLADTPSDPALMLGRLDGVQLVYLASYWQQP